MPTPLTPEQEARQQIDRMLEAAGWQVQARERMNRTAAEGVAVCEFPTATGPVDYLLFAQGRPIGVVEAKKAGTTLSGVEPQAWRYASGLDPALAALAWHDPLPFRYGSTGIETFVADDRDPKARSRRVYTFHRPETLAQWAADAPLVGESRPTGPIGEAGHAYGAATLASRLRHMPPLDPGKLWPAQLRAIRHLEQSLAEDRPRVLTDLVSLVRHALQLEDEFVPNPDRVKQRYEQWLADQAAGGSIFTEEQRWWLDRIAKQIGLNLSVG